MAPSTQPSHSRHPNIVYIMADDMGYGDVGCFNPDSRIPTPNMDKLAAEGIRFTDAHSPSAVCTPTRYGVMTGRYCWRSRLKRGVLYSYEPPLIEQSRLTVASLLKQAGYSTACIGKWHLGLDFSSKAGETIDFDRALPWPSLIEREVEEKIDFTQPIKGGPLDLGFEYFYGTSGCATAQPPYGFIENDRFVEIPSFYDAEPEFTSRPGMTAPSWHHKNVDPIISKKAVEYIESQSASDEPFFIYLNPSSPHEPCVEGVVPEFARGKSGAGPRGDMVWLVDWLVGEVVDALDRAGKASETLIIVTSDNGALPGDRARDGNRRSPYRMYGHKSCGDWRGYKAHIWEGGHREPLIARWPGKIAPGSVSNQLCGLIDLLATCAAITGQEMPDGAAEDSCNLLPALLQPDLESIIREDAIHHSSLGVFSLRREDWKLILDTTGSGGWPPPPDKPPVPGSPGQLYDMKNDPYEQDNLWGDRPKLVAELTELLGKYRDAGSSR